MTITSTFCLAYGGLAIAKRHDEVTGRLLVAKCSKVFFFFFFWVTGELSTLRQLMKVPNDSGLSPNNGLENVSLSNQSMASNSRKGQAKCPGAKTTSHDGRAGHVMTHMCHPSKARRMAIPPR